MMKAQAKAEAAMAKGTVSAVFVAATTSAPNTGEIADSVAGSIDRAEEEEQQLKGSSRLKQA